VRDRQQSGLVPPIEEGGDLYPDSPLERDSSERRRPARDDAEGT